MGASEDQLSLNEFSVALKDLNNGKTPGPDGIPPELYKMFWKQLSTPLYEAYMEVYKEEDLFTSAKEGIINVIPKQNKDTRYIKNLRPITLLNADYKLVEKVIANRIESALPKIIHQDQKGFMPGRHIGINIRRIFDLMNHCRKNKIEAMILSLDFSKCFDRIAHLTINKALQYFNFSQKIQDWVGIMYKDFYVRIQNNGNFSTRLKVSRGVHQGGNASIGIFLICAELLAIKFRSNERILGIPVRDFLMLLDNMRMTWIII